MGSGNRPLFEPVALANLPYFPDAGVQFVEKIPETPCTLHLTGAHMLAGAYHLHNESMSFLRTDNATRLVWHGFDHHDDAMTTPAPMGRRAMGHEGHEEECMGWVAEMNTETSSYII
jgi:hypothetical protein